MREMEEGLNVESGVAEISGAQVYYELAGEGPALVLVHAGIADARMWDEQFRAFAQSFRVVRYDRRGFGRTQTVDGGSYSHHEDLHALLRFLGITRASLVGCSQGGKAVTDFTLEHPSMTQALVLVASALGGFEFEGGQPRQFEELVRADEAGDAERVNELELQIWVDGPHREPHEVDASIRERVREMNRIALLASENSGAEQPLEPPAVKRLGEIGVPTLIITGDLDTPKTLAAARVLAQKIEGAQSVVIKDAAHLPNMERPEEFNRHVLSFLGGLNL
ncbi:MAG TPA: alpha/beta hydrolase [Pyrinomonadaceae bacterium]|nr:alpha/beta hydrolase [Pyrinomonadaceae bacterium]